MTVYLVDFENVRSAGLKGVENLASGDKVVIFYSKNADAITFDVHMLLSKSEAEIETFMILRGGRNSLDFQLSTYLGYLVMENKYHNIVIVSQDKGFLCATSFWDENGELCNAEIVMSKSIESFEMNETKNFIENDNEGKFIEKVPVISKSSRTDGASKDIQNKKDEQPPVRKEHKKENTIAANNKRHHVQNPMSKSKIFAAEVKLNITKDVQKLIKGKYGTEYVPTLVELIGKSTEKQQLYIMLVQKMGQELGREMYTIIKGHYADLKRK